MTRKSGRKATRKKAVSSGSAFSTQRNRVRSNPASASDEVWKFFAHQLFLSLKALEDEEYLVLSRRGKPDYYVQYGFKRELGMRAEASSNFYISEANALADPQHAVMLEIGWHPPTKLPHHFRAGQDQGDGSPNYYFDFKKPIDHGAAAILGVVTFRTIYGVTRPDMLEYSASSKRYRSIRFANLEIKRRQD